MKQKLLWGKVGIKNFSELFQDQEFKKNQEVGDIKNQINLYHG